MTRAHHLISSTITLLLCAGVCLLPSCKKQEATQRQAQELETKIDTINQRLSTLQKQKDEISLAVNFFLESNSDIVAKLEKQKKPQKDARALKLKACLLNLSNIHQAVRADQDLRAQNIGAPLNWDDIIGIGKHIEKMPACQHGGDCILTKTYPKVGTPAATCPHSKEHGHRPESSEGW